MKWNRDARKKELWEKDKNSFQRARINIRLWFLKFNRQTHGMGIIFIMLVIIIIIVQAMSYIIPTPVSQEMQNLQKLAVCMKHHTCTWRV